MIGVTCGKMEDINNFGYRIVECEDEKKMQIIQISDNSVVREFSVTEKGFLQLDTDKGLILKDLKSAFIHMIDNPKALLIEMKDIHGATFWSELPTTNGMPICW